LKALGTWVASGGGGPRFAFLCLGLLAASLGLRAWGARYDMGRRTLEEAAGLSPGASIRVIMLTERKRKPEHSLHSLSVYFPQDLEALRRYSGRRTVFRRLALRRLYEGLTRGMEAEGLREALLMGLQAGDPAAGLLLLESLSSAPRSPEAARALDSLADESRCRIGPQASARLALAYARLGLKEKAAFWQERASRGIPPGLLSLGSVGAFNGVVKGSVKGGRVRVGLYALKGASPHAYALGPSQLVASAWPDEKGRFEFKGLAAGDYFLALSLDWNGPRPQARVLGHRGDIRISAESPRAELAPIELRF